MDCGPGTAAPPPNSRIAVIIQRIEWETLPLGLGAEDRHRQNFLRGDAVGQNTLGGDHVLITFAPIPMPPLLPVKAPLVRLAGS